MEIKDHISDTSYSVSSDSSNDSVISISFTEEFLPSCSNSLSERLSNCQRKSFNLRKSIENSDFSLKKYEVHIMSLEEQINEKDSELNTLCSTIRTCNTELNEQIKNEISFSSFNFKDKRLELQEKIKFTQQRLTKSELECIMKEHQLMALKDFLKNLQKINEFDCQDLKLRIKMMENTKIFLTKRLQKIKFESEVTNLKNFVYEQLKKFTVSYIENILEKFKIKINEILMAEYKFWSAVQIFHESKAEIKRNYIENADFIRKKTQKRLENFSQEKNSQIEILNQEISKSQSLTNYNYSFRPGIISSLKNYANHLNYLDEKINKSQKKHRRYQKKIVRRIRKLYCVEIKLANIKSTYYFKDL